MNSVKIATGHGRGPSRSGISMGWNLPVGDKLQNSTPGMLGHSGQPLPQQPSPIPPPPPPPQTVNPQDLTLAGVLHFLQTEWRRYERDRNEWEIERAEMRARIALLEGERRSFENVKLDLMRRIKMLEYALRVERQALTVLFTVKKLVYKMPRSKQLTLPSQQANKPLTIANLVQKDDQIPKEGSGSSSPHSEDSPLPQENNRLSIGSLPMSNGSQKPPPYTNVNLPGSINIHAANLGKPPPGRDPKSRARSRDYLKQRVALIPSSSSCLQEITYLTSPQAVNPLPNRQLLNTTTASGPLANATAPALPLALPNLPSFENPAYNNNGRDPAGPISNDQSASNSPFNTIINGRPRKVVPEVGKDFPLLGNKEFPAPGGPMPNSKQTFPRVAGISVMNQMRAEQGQLFPDKEQGNGPMGIPPAGASTAPTGSTLSRSNTLTARNVANYTDSTRDVEAMIAPALPIDPQLPQQEQIQPSISEEPVDTAHLTPAPPPPQLVDIFRMEPADPQPAPQSSDEEPAPNQSTAIFRPDDAGKWKEQLRLANDRAGQSGYNSPGAFGGALSVPQNWDTRLREFVDEEDSIDDETGVGVGLTDGEEGTKLWKAKRTLRNHLDAVRAISFHPNDMLLATGSDDCTVKIWRMDVASLASTTSRPTTEIEPQITLRGHSASITRLVHSPSKGLLYSASLDSTIRVWALPSPTATTYAAYDASLDRGSLVGHTDAVWDITLVREESVLVSCGAEGVIKVWDVSGPATATGPNATPGSLKLSWGYAGLGVDPHPEEVACTAIEGVKTDLKKVAVAFRDAVVKLFDIETGAEVGRFMSDSSSDGTTASQVNKIVSHPTMPLLVTAHEDKYIRLFDITTGQCTHSMLAHLDGVTSLSIDPTGFSLVSGGHDCSVRFWDLLNKRTCVQEIATHRKKADEGVLDVEFHPSLPFMASAGADGVVKLYASS